MLRFCMLLLLLTSLAGAGGISARSAAPRELIRDPGFQRGFILLDPAPGKRVALGVLPGLVPDTKTGAVWDLAQWSSKETLRLESRQRWFGGALRYANGFKSVTLGMPGTEEASVSLRVNAEAEYGGRARKSGEPWVHLLAQQEIEKPPALSELSAARLRIEVRLRSAQRIETPDYSRDLHAAQFQLFFSVQNLNRASPGYGQYLWFGVPLYDDRHRVAPAHQAPDTGGTQMFIYTPAGSVFSRQSAHDKKWLTVDADVLPLLRRGLETAWQRGFLKDSQSLADYRIASLNLGWEVPGIFNVEMQVRKLSLKVTSQRNP